MLARIRKSMDEKDQGFTLIELLVVMIIIGILSAIAIPVFLSQRTKARETSAKADVSVIGKEVAAYYVDGTAALTASGNTNSGWKLATNPVTTDVSTGKLSNGNKIVATNIVSSGAYCVAVQSGFAVDGTGSSTDKAWAFTQDGLIQRATCP